VTVFQLLVIIKIKVIEQIQMFTQLCISFQGKGEVKANLTSNISQLDVLETVNDELGDNCANNLLQSGRINCQIIFEKCKETSVFEIKELKYV